MGGFGGGEAPPQGAHRKSNRRGVKKGSKGEAHPFYKWKIGKAKKKRGETSLYFLKKNQIWSGGAFGLERGLAPGKGKYLPFFS